jgi:hypothetical protein
MNIFELEKLRKKKLAQFFLSFLIDILWIVCFVLLFSSYALESEMFRSILGFAVLIFLVISVMWKSGIIKGFENDVKLACINDIISNILDGRGEIVWHRDDWYNEPDKLSIETERLIKEVRALANEPDKQTAKIKMEQLEQEMEALIKEHDTKPRKKVASDYMRDIEQTVKESKLVIGFTSDETDDIFTGQYKGAEIQIAETRFTRKGSRSDFTIFKGIVITLKTDGEFKGRTIIGKDKGNFHKAYAASIPYLTGLQKLDIPIKAFAEKYDVYTDNIEEAGKILTSDLCNFLVGTKNKIRIACYKNNIAATVSAKRDMFKLGNLFKKVDDQKQFIKFTRDFHMLINVIDGLKKIFVL